MVRAGVEPNAYYVELGVNVSERREELLLVLVAALDELARERGFDYRTIVPAQPDDWPLPLVFTPAQVIETYMDVKDLAPEGFLKDLELLSAEFFVRMLQHVLYEITKRTVQARRRRS